MDPIQSLSVCLILTFLYKLPIYSKTLFFLAAESKIFTQEYICYSNDLISLKITIHLHILALSWFAGFVYFLGILVFSTYTYICTHIYHHLCIYIYHQASDSVIGDKSLESHYSNVNGTIACLEKFHIEVESPLIIITTLFCLSHTSTFFFVFPHFYVWNFFSSYSSSLSCCSHM